MGISWLSSSGFLYRSIRDGQPARPCAGGDEYHFQAAVAADRFGLEVDPRAIRRDNELILRYWRRIAHIQARGKIAILEPTVLVFANHRLAATEIALVHHLDHSLARRSPKWAWFFYRLKNRLRKVDCVVTVSKFWQTHLRELGCKDVRLIYNSFDPGEFNFSAAEIAQFRKAHGLDEQRPVIYIGNARVEKGVAEIYEALRSTPFQLVTSGRRDPRLRVPVRNLDLARRDYLLLLKTCDVVVLMSNFAEGWNRSAHEAMLCGTPVIGNGAGGMEELLVEGGQTVERDFSRLRPAIERAIENREEHGRRGLEYVAQYDLAYFQNAWVRLLEEMLARKSCTCTP